MRILLISSVPIEKNGITNVMFNYFNSIEVDIIQFDWLSINDPEELYKNQIKARNGTLFVIPRSRKTLVCYFMRLKKLIQKQKYNAVHIHGNSHTLVLELLAAKMAGCPVRIVHAHNTTSNSVFIHKLLTPIFDSLYTHGLACGIDAGKWMYGNKNFKVVNNGIDTSKFSFDETARDEFRQKCHYKDNSIIIGHVGYFTAVKNQGFIVDVFNKIYLQDNRYRLILIGDGELRNEIEYKVCEYGLTNVVTFTGNINNVSDYLNAIDVIVMPSLFEGLPLALIEQQANGLQSVVADTITKEVDKSGNIYFLSLSNPLDQWAKKIMSIDCLHGRIERSNAAIISIIESGYSIQKEAKELRGYYIESITNSK